MYIKCLFITIICALTGTPLGEQAIASYNASLSEATVHNRYTQATAYLTFTVYYGVNILFPNRGDCCLFQQYLANSLTSPASRGNYTSGAKIWVEERGGDGRYFRCPDANKVAKGAQNANPHTPHPAPALMPQDLVAACRFLDKALSGLPVKAAVCIGYFAFLRRSNLLSPSAALWPGPHTLQRQDIISNQEGLQVVIRSSKTIKRGTLPTVLVLPRIPTSPACPATAWDRYVDMIPGSPTSPAFLLQDGQPLTSQQMVIVLQAALLDAGCPYALQISSHSLRRGGAQAAVASGCSKKDVAVHGTWKSKSGLRSYIPSHSSLTVARGLASLFAPKSLSD